MYKKVLLTAIILIFIALFISCSTDKKTSEEPIQTVETTVKVDTTQPEPEVNEFVMPDFTTRPFAVMIDNEGTKSLPQGGLNKAQIIYEIIVEGGETRLMPVFWNTDATMIGPVRSSRHYFLDYAMENDAIYVHFGWSPMAKSDISTLGINNINGITNGGSIFWDLTGDRYNWQDSYTSMEKIKNFTKRVKYRTTTEKTPVFSYNNVDQKLSNGTIAEKINIKYSYYTCGYKYDTKTGMYLRFRKGLPQMERVSGKQLRAKNIIIQFTGNYTLKGDTAGRQNVNTVGSGSGYFITGGKSIKISWSKVSRSAQTKYTDVKGNPIKLNQGQTWVQITPTYGKVTIN